MNITYLTAALTLAKKRLGFCAPNPSVGAVVVKDNKIIGEGYHLGPGHPHAEVMALNKLSESAQGADIYITLEPCCHHGRTPPCTDLIIEHKLKHVYFSLLDPNPLVSGQGKQRLRDLGVVCEHVPLPEIDAFYESYQFWWKNKHPFVTTKLALTADRKTAGINGQPLKITGDACQKFTQEQRLKHDALLTTAQTIIADNPHYNTRLVDAKVKKPLYVLDAKGRMPLEARIFKTCDPVTIFYGEHADLDHITRLILSGVDCKLVPELANGHLDLHACLRVIGEQHHSLWMEAGWTCTQSFIAESLSQKLYFYFSKRMAGEAAMPQLPMFSYENGVYRDISWMNLGGDVLVVL